LLLLRRCKGSCQNRKMEIKCDGSGNISKKQTVKLENLM